MTKSRSGMVTRDTTPTEVVKLKCRLLQVDRFILVRDSNENVHSFLIHRLATNVVIIFTNWMGTGSIWTVDATLVTKHHAVIEITWEGDFTITRNVSCIFCQIGNILLFLNSIMLQWIQLEISFWETLISYKKINTFNDKRKSLCAGRLHADCHHATYFVSPTFC